MRISLGVRKSPWPWGASKGHLRPRAEARRFRRANNLGDGLELFPVNVPDYPDDFAFNIVEDFKGLKIYGNRGLPINHPPTEN